jgi:hypothetical protein
MDDVVALCVTRSARIELIGIISDTRARGSSEDSGHDVNVIISVFGVTATIAPDPSPPAVLIMSSTKLDEYTLYFP